MNWGKESVGINLKSPEGQRLVHELAAKADFVITSFKPGSAGRIRMAYSDFRAINPSVIYGGISGYGEASERVGYDAIIQAESGFMFLNREPDHLPMKMPVALVDLLAAHQLKEAMLCAHINRLNTGKGCEVNISLMDAALASLANQGANYLVAGSSPQPTGSEHPNIAPYGEFLRTADGRQILLAVGNDAQFYSLCHILGLPALITDTSFESNRSRVENRRHLLELLNQAAVKLNSSDILRGCLEHHVPAGEIKTVTEAIDAMPAEMKFLSGELAGIRTFVPARQSLSAPPLTGAHTRQVLSEVLNLNTSRLDELYASGVIG